MDLPCAPWQDHVAQKWLGLDSEIKEKFTSLQDIDGVFQCALSLITPSDLDFLQSISAAYDVQKQEDEAAKCRERGNSCFKSRNYSAAALHYSQGVCAAPQKSEQLSLCYANRSAALYHLQLYQECLLDIDEALRNGYPSHLSRKLQDRRTMCLKDLDAQAKEAGSSPASRTNEGPSGVKAPSARLHMFGVCPQAAVSSSVEKGRHLVAVEGIAAGEVILGDRPYSCVLIPGLQEVSGSGREEEEAGGAASGTESRRCHRCLSATLRPVPCDGCRYSRYCSAACRRDAWEEHHRWECPLGADLAAMGVMLQLALRVALKAGSKNIQAAQQPIADDHNEPKPDCLGSEPSFGHSYSSVFRLLHHLRRHSPTMRFLCAVTVATVYLKLSKAGPPPASWRTDRTARTKPPDDPNTEGGDDGWSSEQWLLGSAVLRHTLQLRCNAQAVVARQDTGAENLSVQSSREIRVATAIFPTLSLLNHSCRPNTSLAFDTGPDAPADSGASVAEDERAAVTGVTVTVRAAKAVAPGQEILHCYGPHSSRMATHDRQRLLQEQYFFLCQCEACSLQQQEKEEEEEEEEAGKEQRAGAGGGAEESAVLCRKCKGTLKKVTDDRGAWFLCSLPSCGPRMSSSEVWNQLQQLSVDLQKAVELLERDRPGEALKLLKRTRCQSGLILAETHPLQGELADATARAYATMGDWKNAAAQLERSAVAVASQYGEESIELGQQLFKLAQLHFNGGARGPALSVIRKVRRLLCLHLGPHCPELQELKAMEDCLRGAS